MHKVHMTRNIRNKGYPHKNASDLLQMQSQVLILSNAFNHF